MSRFPLTKLDDISETKPFYHSNRSQKLQTEAPEGQAIGPQHKRNQARKTLLSINYFRRSNLRRLLINGTACIYLCQYDIYSCEIQYEY